MFKRFHIKFYKNADEKIPYVVPWWPRREALAIRRCVALRVSKGEGFMVMVLRLKKDKHGMNATKNRQKKKRIISIQINKNNQNLTKTSVV